MIDRIDVAIWRLTGWRCPGPCFPLVGRGWDAMI